MRVPRSRIVTLAAVISLLVLHGRAEEDWPQWRGLHRDGSIASFPAPQAWPEALKPAWKLAVGEGHASPVRAGDKIFVFTRQQGEEVLSCVEPAHGHLVWRAAYPAPYKVNPAADRHGPGPKATPVVQGGSVYTLGIGAILSAFDASNGKTRWRKDFAREFHETSPWYGTASSPVVDGALLIVNIGGNDDGALLGIDSATGTVKWKWKEDGPGYASPMVAELAGVRQVITQTQQNIVGIAVATGQLLWKIPFTTEFTQNIVTPFIYGDTLILSGLSKGTMAVRPGKKDGRWFTETLWHNQDVSMYMSSPVMAGDRVFGFSSRNKGQLFGLDARTGSTLWIGPPRQGDNAALVAAGGLLFVLKDNAELEIGTPGATSFAPLRRYTVATSPTWAHPLILPQGLVIKDASTLALWNFQ